MGTPYSYLGNFGELKGVKNSTPENVRKTKLSGAFGVKPPVFDLGNVTL
jgi:hypothetical protein